MLLLARSPSYNHKNHNKKTKRTVTKEVCNVMVLQDCQIRERIPMKENKRDFLRSEVNIKNGCIYNF